VLVVGSSGYVGRQVVRELADRGADVTGADISPGGPAGSARIDLAFAAQSDAVLHATMPDVVVNMAYLLAAAIDADPQRGIETNVVGVNGLFEACLRHGVQRVVYASSGSVFGDQSIYGDRAVTEDTPLPPARTLYQLMKQFNERMAEHYNAEHGRRFVALRISSPHGRGRAHGLNPFDRLVAAARAGTRSVALPWRSAHGFAFNHVDDVARAVAVLALAPATRWSIYNLGGEPMTVGRLAAIARSAAGIEASFDEGGDPARYMERIASERIDAEFGMSRRSAADHFADELRAA
jgi:nucleoside-diphosphate-sugar epimerase